MHEVARGIDAGTACGKVQKRGFRQKFKVLAITVIANPGPMGTVALTWPGLRDSVSGGGRVTAPAGVQATIFATVSPKAEGVGTMDTPASFRISTFSCADSPKADTMAPAWPMRRPLGADRPAT